MKDDITRLLVLDGSEAEYESAVAALRRSGWRIDPTRATTRPQFQAALRQGAPDLIVSEFDLGGWTALDALAALRESGADIPFVVLTSGLADESAAECMRQGASEYVLKAHWDRLGMAAARALESKRMRGHTELLRAELSRTKAELEQVFNNAGDPVLVFDEHGRVRRANRLACALVGATAGTSTIACERLPLLEELRALLRDRGLLAARQPTQAEIEFQGRVFDVIAGPVQTGGPLRDVALSLHDITERKRAEGERLSLLHNLRERVKELNCMFRVARAAQACGEPRELFRQAVEFLPPAFQHDEVTCAAIEFDGCTHSTGCCAETPWLLTAPIVMNGAPRGAVKVVYTEERPAADEGPFLREEGALVEAVAGLLGEALERIEAQNAQRSTNEMLGAVVRNSPLAIITVDGGGKIATWNPAAERIFGWKAAEVIGGGLPYVPAEHRAAHAGLIHRVLAGEILPGVELERVRKDGSRVLVRLSTASLRDRSGNSSGALAVVEDVSPQRQAEEALRRSEQKYRSVVSNIPDVAWTSSEDGSITFIGPNVAAITGFTAEQVIANPRGCWFSRIHQGDVERVQCAYHNLFATGEPFEQEYRYQRSDGRWIWLRDRALRTYQSDGGHYADGLSTDITASKEAEQALRRSEQRYRSLFENASDIIVLLDAAGRFTGINQAGERATGYSRDEFLKLRLEDVLWPESWPAARDALRTGLRGESLPPFEVAARRRDSTRLEVEVTGQALVEEGEPTGVQVIARDLSERKLLQEQLLQAQKMEAVGRLAGGVAHDFNNLLTVISGYSEMLMDLCTEVQQRSAAETVFSAAGRAASLTAQLLAFSRKQVLQPRVISLNQVVGGIREMLRRLIGENVDLISVLDAGLRNVKADPAQIEQVIVNLALNARDAMPNGGKLVIETCNAVLDEEVARRHPSVDAGSYVRLTISDTGLGMDEATRACIFEPFFTTKERGKGTGLGLATVFGIVRQSGGWIWVYSEPRRGSTFKVYLPAVEDEAGPVEPALEKELPGHETVLVVEDQAEVRALIREILERNGYRVQEAATADDAISMLQPHAAAPSLLITDLVIGQHSGMQLAERICALKPDTRVLYMSGYTEAASTPAGGASAPFLEKPFTAVSLTHKVRQALEAPAVAGGAK